MKAVAGLVAAVLGAVVLGAAFVVDASQAPGGTGRVAVDLKSPGTPVPPRLYGIFYEEINHAGDGGLYAELVRNRGFEDANLPPACTRDGDFIMPPRTPHFDTGKPNDWRLRWDVENRIRRGRWRWLRAATPRSSSPPRSAARSDAALVACRSTSWRPERPRRHRQQRLLGHRRQSRRRVPCFRSHGAPTASHGRDRWRRSRRRQDASRWLGVHSRRLPDAGSARWVAPDGGRAARHEAATAQCAARADVRQYRRARGSTWCRCFRAKTFKNRPNGLRPDLAQVVADMKPGFVRATGRLLRRRHHDRKPAAVEAIARTDRNAARHLQSVGLLEHGRLRVPRVPAVLRRHRRRRAVGRQRRRVVLVPQRHVPARRRHARPDPGHAGRD